MPIFKFSISMHSFCFMRRQNFDGSSKAHIYCAPYSNCSQLSQCGSTLASSGLCSQLLWLWQIFSYPNSTSCPTSAHMLPTVWVFIWPYQDQSCIHFSSLLQYIYGTLCTITAYTLFTYIVRFSGLILFLNCKVLRILNFL